MKKVVPPRMTGQAFLREVRELAAQSRNIFIVHHARRRMIQRRFTDEDVQQALLRGQIEEGRPGTIETIGRRRSVGCAPARKSRSWRCSKTVSS
jgi:hypothetical protein